MATIIYDNPRDFGTLDKEKRCDYYSWIHHLCTDLEFVHHQYAGKDGEAYEFQSKRVVDPKYKFYMIIRRGLFDCACDKYYDELKIVDIKEGMIFREKFYSAFEKTPDWKKWLKEVAMKKQAMKTFIDNLNIIYYDVYGDPEEEARLAKQREKAKKRYQAKKAKKKIGS